MAPFNYGSIVWLFINNWSGLLVLLLSCTTLTFPAEGSELLLSDTQCSQESLEAYDIDIARLMTVGQRLWPENFSESKPFCAETRKLNERINTFKSRCPTGSAKEFTSVIIYSIQRAMKTYCPKQANKKVLNFLRSKACTNSLFNETKQCLDTYIDQLQGIINAPIKKQIPHACCQYYELLQCFDNAFQPLPNCADSADTFLNFVRQLFADIANMTCMDYTESSDKCDHLGRPPAKDPKLKRTKSFLFPLINIWHKIEAENNNQQRTNPAKDS